MSEIRPKLKAVGEGGTEAAAEGARADATSPEAPPTSRATWLLAGLLLLAFLALVIQTSRVGALSGEVARLSADLAGARAALLAYEGRLATVREVVGDLSRRVGQLDELVRRDPLAPPEPEDLEVLPAPERGDLEVLPAPERGDLEALPAPESAPAPEAP